VALDNSARRRGSVARGTIGGEGDPNGMPQVIVFLSNGKDVMVDGATEVKGEPFLGLTVSGKTLAGVLCKDAKGKTLAVFKAEDISGYRLDP